MKLTLQPPGNTSHDVFRAAALSTIVSCSDSGTGVCSSKKRTLRTTGTAGADAIEKITCV